MRFYALHSRVLLASALATAPIVANFNERKIKPSRQESKIEKARELIESAMAVQGIPGLAIAVSVDGDVVWKQGFGFSNVETMTKCTGDSVMRIASISKSITAALTGQLVENGSLDLDADIRDYLANFPVKTFENEEVVITMRQLLSHTAGIRHYASSKTKRNSFEDPGNSNTTTEEFLSNKYYATSDEAVNIFRNDDLVEKPGTFAYTTYGITLASAVLEAASGRTYRQLATKLFSDLGMKSTQLDTKQKIVSKRVSYYLRNSGHILENCPEVDCSNKFAGGGIVSNTTDLIIFANAVLNSLQSPCSNNLLRKETIEQFMSNHASVNANTCAGLGWFLVSGSNIITSCDQQHALPYFYHTGAAVGASSALLIRPDNYSTQYPSGICVAVLCNVQDVSVLPLALSIADLFFEIRNIPHSEKKIE